MKKSGRLPYFKFYPDAADARDGVAERKGCADVTCGIVERLCGGFRRLVMTRRCGEKIVIHDRGGIIATVQWSEKSVGIVKVSIEAPPGVAIDREEVFERKFDGTSEIKEQRT